MLEVSALPPVAPLLQAVGQKGEGNGELMIDGGFSALLAAQIESETPPQLPVPPVSAAAVPALIWQPAKLDGNPGAKALPDRAELPAEDAEKEDAPAAESAPTFEITYTSFLTLAAQPVSFSAAIGPATGPAAATSGQHAQPLTKLTPAPPALPAIAPGDVSPLALPATEPNSGPAIGAVRLILPDRLAALPYAPQAIEASARAAAEQFSAGQDPTSAVPKSADASAPALAALAAPQASKGLPRSVAHVRAGVAHVSGGRGGDAETAPAPVPAAAALLPAAAPVLADALPPAIVSGDAQAAPANNPAIVSTASAPVLRHDFAALVDRLTEARDIALSGQSPQTVHAAIAHEVFGAVSLRFETGSAGLSVALASADPDFARAVQAAAPSAAGMANGENPTPQSRQDSPRPDTAGQQSAGSGAFMSNENSRNSSNSPARSGSPSATRAPFSDQGRSDTSRPSRPSGEVFA